MSKADYERLIAELKASGVHEPEGRLFHAGYGNEDLEMFELWESEGHFDTHREHLFAALESVGLACGSVEICALHSPRPDRAIAMATQP